MKRHRPKSCAALVFVCFLTALLSLLSPQRATAADIVCIDCHAKLPGKYGEPVKLWRGSIHDENGIACNSCHGGDPKDAANAMSPGRGFLGAPKEKDIPAFCGRCHVGVLKDYLSSLHGKALGKGGPTCVTCHGNHRVVKASLALINEKTCSQCHDYRQAERIKGVMTKTESRLMAIDAAITGFKQQGTDTDSLEKGLFAVRNSFHSLFHTVDASKVEKDGERMAAELQKLDERLRQVAEQQYQRKLYGAFAVAGALLLALLLYLLRKTYDQRQPDS
jgi:hypothetical protein